MSHSEDFRRTDKEMKSYQQKLSGPLLDRFDLQKNLNSSARLHRQQQFALTEFDSLRATYLGVRPLGGNQSSFADEPFALIHRG